MYNRVCVSSSLTHNGLSNCPPHKGVFEVLNQMKSDYVGPEKIYISRRTWLNGDTSNIGTNYTERRKCVNEDEVAQMFIDQGFKEIFCENLTMEEKIGMFRSAKYVAGPIGGGMCNVIFSPPETKVLSINSPTFFDVNLDLDILWSIQTSLILSILSLLTSKKSLLKVMGHYLSLED